MQVTTHSRTIIRDILVIAFPIVISQGSNTLMLFTDRFFMSKLGPVHLAAAMGGGLTNFMLFSFLFGLLSYVTTLAAQYIGAGQKTKAPVALSQALLIGVIAYPFMVAVGYFLSGGFAFFGHTPLQVELETRYFQVLLVGSIFMTINVTFSSFFSGIGRTRIVMQVNIIATLINIPLTWILVFGYGQIPAMGITGAALGSILAGATGSCLFVIHFFGKEIREYYQVMSAFKYDPTIMKKLLKFGGPSGVQTFLNIFAFNLFILTFQSYGTTAAAAVTIVFNWDMANFIPILGLQIGVMSLVGKAMGEGNPDRAEAIVKWGLVIGLTYTFVLALIYLLFATELIGLFSDDSEGLAMGLTLMYGLVMYMFADTVTLVVTGALKGAGDTKWLMWMSAGLHWLMLTAQIVMIKVFLISPEESWYGFVVFILILSIATTYRFRKKQWRSISVL